jgi:hypothetical protein
MDAKPEDVAHDKEPVYITPKRVQVWFLKCSRDRWKKRAKQLRSDLKRLRQRVTDVSESRANWRSEAEAARREAEQLRSQNAQLQARLEQLAQDSQKKSARRSQRG